MRFTTERAPDMLPWGRGGSVLCSVSCTKGPIIGPVCWACLCCTGALRQRCGSSGLHTICAHLLVLHRYVSVL